MKLSKKFKTPKGRFNTQLKYLPLLRDAVDRGKAEASNLALMEDRIALRRERKQIYGSQIKINAKTGEYYVASLEDPDSVNIWSAKVGLPTIITYASRWEITWSLEQYINDLASESQE